MAHIDYYFSTVSPFTYIAGMRFEDVAKKHGATVTYKPLDIVALFARTGGTAPADRHPARLELRAQELRRQAKKNGIEIDLDPPLRAANSAPSAYAFIAAVKAGGGDPGKLVHAIAGAHWRDKRDIAEDAVIAECLEEAGYDGGIATGMGAIASADDYMRNLEDAVAAGVFGAPFYVVDGTEKFWGQDRIEDLDLYLSGKL